MIAAQGKPIIFPIIHDEENVAKEMEKFRKALEGKEVLYIEIFEDYYYSPLKDPSFNKEGVEAYRKLILEAQKMGLKVIPLDVSYKKKAADYRRAGFPRSASQQPDIAHLYYLNITKRDRRWCGLLKNANSNSLVVMHPGHAINIVKLLSIPKRNVINANELMRYRTFSLETESGMAKDYASRLQQARTKRRLRSAKERFKAQVARRRI